MNNEELARKLENIMASLHSFMYVCGELENDVKKIRDALRENEDDLK